MDVVADPDDRHDESQLQSALPADKDNAVQKISALPSVCQRNQPVTELEFDRIHLQQIDDTLRRAYLLNLLLFDKLLVFRLLPVQLLLHFICGEREQPGYRSSNDVMDRGKHS